MEVVLALAIVMSLCAIGVPALAHVADARRTRDASSFLAGQFRMARQRAVMTGRYVAVVFDDAGGEVGWRTCLDGDRDGVSRSDIASGTDRCERAAEAVSFRFPDVRVEYLPGVPSPDGDLAPAPLRFGTAAMAAFSPAGTASSGTVALRGAGSAQFAVRVAGVTGRTRVLEFDPGRRVWVE
ncbi:MAG: GspH/FimT family pseudopilin [Acidobacteria bacterium]|nr:GspH/FimT family pseudopilin [Acidobacteriota bacterium]